MKNKHCHVIIQDLRRSSSDLGLTDLFEPIPTNIPDVITLVGAAIYQYENSIESEKHNHYLNIAFVLLHSILRHQRDMMHLV